MKRVKHIDYTHRPNSGAHFAIPIILLLGAVIAAVMWSQ